MTNNEWLNQLSIENKAEILLKWQYDLLTIGTKTKDEWVEWLKSRVKSDILPRFDKCKYCHIEYTNDVDPYGHGDYKIICTKNNKVANYLYCTEKCNEGEEVEE